MRFVEINAAVERTGLGIVGAFHCGPGDRVPQGSRTLVLLGPEDGAMWAEFRRSTEAADGYGDPLDRWSRRVITALAEAFSATAFLPFGGPPWHPFQLWAARGEAAVTSPVGMQATPRRGLWASYRGALGFAERLDLPASPGEVSCNPCIGCPAPCLTACPVGAFADGTYDVPACVAYLTSEAGTGCRGGCRVRTSCPAGEAVELPAEQRAFHMTAFLRSQAEDLSIADRKSVDSLNP